MRYIRYGSTTKEGCLGLSIAGVIISAILMLAMLSCRALVNDTESDLLEQKFTDAGCTVGRYDRGIYGGPGQIYGVRIKSHLNQELAELFMLAPSCKHIHLDGGKIDIEQLKRVLAFCKITTLKISNESLTDERFLLCDGFMDHVEYLYIKNVDYDDSTLDPLLNIPNLRAITIWNVKYTDEGLANFRAKRPEVNIYVSNFP